MRYAIAAVFLVVLIHVSSHSVGATGDDSSSQPDRVVLQTQTHDLAVSYVVLVGPAATNLSDTNGRYMWVLSAFRSNSGHAELAELTVSIEDNVADGCERSESLILPGQTTMLAAPGEPKTVISRVRYQCHAPATPQALRQTVAVTITHCGPEPEPTPTPDPTPEPAPDDTLPPEEPVDLCPDDGGAETNLANNVASATKQILIQ